MSSRGEPRLWLIVLTLPTAIAAATLMGILSAPAMPGEQPGRNTDFTIVLLLGLFLILLGVFVTVAVILWKRSLLPQEVHHELIATLPSVDESPDEARFGNPRSGDNPK